MRYNPAQLRFSDGYLTSQLTVTCREVHKAIHREKGHTVALKRILMHNEKEGMPVTALREIKILKALRHSCIVDILDMFVVRSASRLSLISRPLCLSRCLYVTSGHGKESPLSVYMVFPYMDHDLAGLLENERVKLTPSQIKLYMKQLLEGTEYMHRVGILSVIFVHYAGATTSAEPHPASRYESGEPADLK